MIPGLKSETWGARWGYSVDTPEGMVMSAWLISAGALAVAAASLAAQFYFKWVPSVEDQKRHLKQAASWVMDLLTLVAQAVAMYHLARHEGLITPGFVVEVALCSSGAVFCVILIFIRRWILGDILRRSLDNFGLLIDTTDRHSSNFGRLLQFTERHLAATEQHTDALRLLANDSNLSVETVQALRTILNGRPDKLAIPKAVDDKNSGTLE